MGRDVSIMITAKDNYSQAITTMRNANNSFNKDLDGLSTKLDALNKTKYSLKVDFDKAKTTLKEAEKQFAATGDAADKMAYDLASQDYETARRNLDLVSKNARQAERDINNLTDAVSKSDNRMSKGAGGMLSAIGQAGLYDMVGQTLSQAADTLAASAYGSEAGAMFGSVLASAGSGAALGTMVGGPGVGTAIGAIAGAAVGAIQGGIQVFQQEDDAYKSSVQDLYESVQQTQSDMLTSGTTIAGTREQNKIAFSTLLGGDDRAKEFLDSLTEFAATTPFEYDQLTTISRTLLAYGYKQDELLPLLTKIGDAGSALGMSADDMAYVATALGRMQTTGKTTMEYLNPLLERGIPVWDYLAEASGKTKAEVQEMVTKGLVPGAEAAKAIADYMGSSFSGNMEKQSHTYEGLLSSLEDAQNEIDNAMGEGYTTERKKGAQAQLDWLSGASGEDMKSAYSLIGTYQASLENEKEEYVRKAMDDVMQNSAEYHEAEVAGNYAKMGELLAAAQAKAQNDYMASDGYQEQVQANLDLVQDIQQNTVLQDEYWNTGYIMGQAFSKGRAAAVSESAEFEAANQAWLADMAKNTGKGLGGYRGTPAERAAESSAGSQSTGLYGGTYGDYSALLHGGQYKPASEAGAAGSKAGPTVTVTGNTFNVRSEEDADLVAQKIAEKLMGAAAVTP